MKENQNQPVSIQSRGDVDHPLGQHQLPREPPAGFRASEPRGLDDAEVRRLRLGLRLGLGLGLGGWFGDGWIVEVGVGVLERGDGGC